MIFETFLHFPVGNISNKNDIFVLGNIIFCGLILNTLLICKDNYYPHYLIFNRLRMKEVMQFDNIYMYVYIVKKYIQKWHRSVCMYSNIRKIDLSPRNIDVLLRYTVPFTY